MKPFYIYRTQNGWIVLRRALHSLNTATLCDDERARTMHSFNSRITMIKWLNKTLAEEERAGG